jgi:hypothetical protein
LPSGNTPDAGPGTLSAMHPGDDPIDAAARLLHHYGAPNGITP